MIISTTIIIVIIITIIVIIIIIVITIIVIIIIIVIMTRPYWPSVSQNHPNIGTKTEAPSGEGEAVKVKS